MFSSTFPEHLIYKRMLGKKYEDNIFIRYMKKILLLCKNHCYHVYLSLFTELFTLPMKYFLLLYFIYACESLSYKFRRQVYLVISIFSYNKILKCVNKWRIGIMSFTCISVHIRVCTRMHNQSCIYSRVNTII